MDDKPSSAARIAAYLFLPIAFVLVLPILILAVVAFYLLAALHALGTLAALMVGRTKVAEPAMQKPHFVDASVPPIPHGAEESQKAP